MNYLSIKMETFFGSQTKVVQKKVIKQSILYNKEMPVEEVLVTASELYAATREAQQVDKTDEEVLSIAKPILNEGSLYL